MLIFLIPVQVSCAVRSYWSQLPEVKSTFVESVVDYFVGIKCSSVITFLDFYVFTIISVYHFNCMFVNNWLFFYVVDVKLLDKQIC